ncbi:MAG: ABC transporter ATP-binding protein [Alphaproteobacteria bacterium]|nr:ABC transporter ATP-binding protein [Alphaproteobacteria bacterium]
MGAVPMLEVTGLTAFYGWARILFDLSFSVGRGEVAVLLGRNGAGKSTTLKSIVGLVRPSSGSVAFRGAGIAGLPPHRIVRMGLGYVPEERRIFTDLTVAENLEVGRQPPRPDAPEWSMDKLFALFPNLAEMQGRPAGQMSGGEQQMLTVARTLMGNPSLILLDEPSEGLAPVIVDQMAATIRALKNRGLSILLSEQNFRFARMVSDRAYIIEKGRIQWQGSMDDLAADEAAKQQYLVV